MEFEKLFRKTLTNIEVVGAEEIYFTTTEGKKYKMYHSQDCCEGVYIEDICGDIEDLIGQPLIIAREATSQDFKGRKKDYDSVTWTFYHLATAKGYVTIRWNGSSNGYYSEGVNFRLAEEGEG